MSHRFYDKKSEQFCPEGSEYYPEDEHNNAVMVSISSSVPTILRRSWARIVVYVESCGLLALGEDSEIRPRPGRDKGDQPYSIDI